MWRLDRSWMRIIPVEVVKETAARVTIRGNLYGGRICEGTYAKKSESYSFHPTWEEAHAEAVEIAEKEVQAARVYLERVKGKLGNVKGMKKP